MRKFVASKAQERETLFRGANQLLDYTARIWKRGKKSESWGKSFDYLELYASSRIAQNWVYR